MKKRSHGNGDGVEILSSNEETQIKKKRFVGFKGQRGVAVSKSLGYYNPALIKRQKEFYKNASYVSKFRKNLKHHKSESSATPSQDCVKEAEGREEVKSNKLTRKATYGLNEVYKKHKNSKEKEKMEKEAAIAARKQLTKNAEGRRKAERQKMMKKTTRGQPLMRFRIDNLLQTIKDSSTS